MCDVGDRYHTRSCVSSQFEACYSSRWFERGGSYLLSHIAQIWLIPGQYSHYTVIQSLSHGFQPCDCQGLKSHTIDRYIVYQRSRNTQVAGSWTIQWRPKCNNNKNRCLCFWMCMLWGFFLLTPKQISLYARYLLGKFRSTRLETIMGLFSLWHTARDLLNHQLIFMDWMTKYGISSQIVGIRGQMNALLRKSWNLFLHYQISHWIVDFQTT